MSSVYVEVELVTLTCCNTHCGILFGVPARWKEKKKEDHKEFFCPNGHPQVFLEKTELDIAKQRLAFERSIHDQTKAALRDKSKQLSTTKGVLTRTKNRVKHGVCPCCKRQFQNVRRHMKTKHPEFVSAGGNGKNGK